MHCTAKYCVTEDLYEGPVFRVIKVIRSSMRLVGNYMATDSSHQTSLPTFIAY